MRNSVAELALSRYEMRLAKSLAHVINILYPDVIVLGGGMATSTDLRQQVPTLVKQWVFGGGCESLIRKAVTVTPAACGEARCGCGRNKRKTASCVAVLMLYPLPQGEGRVGHQIAPSHWIRRKLLSSLVYP
ncbi:ROK family protein [Enterobacter hormaechei]